MNSDSEFAKLPREESLRFGFAEGDEWMTHLLAASRPELSGAIGSYELIEEVGRGGQGVVYRARQPGMQRDIAVKRMIAGSFASRATRRRFEREVETASTLQHPGIVTIYGMEMVDDVPVLAMEWIDGRQVNEWAREGDARRNPQRVLHLFLRICDAVAHAHQRGVIHCDLKPSNILVDREERPRILDFGLARFQDGDRDDSVVTKEAGFIGTLAYASPEQIGDDGEGLDVRSDVYSLGIVLYELLVGTKPDRGRFGGASAMGASSPLRELEFPRGCVGRELRIILRTATAARREERYGSVAEFAADLRRHLAGHPILAHPPGAFYMLWKFVARNRIVSALAATLLFTLIAFATVSSRQARRLAIERDAEATARRDAEDAGAKTESILQFLVEDMLLAVEPKALGDDVSVGQLLAVAAERAGERFADQPQLEARVRLTLAQAYDRLGLFPQAVAEQRGYIARLAERPRPNKDVLIRAEFELALYLMKVEDFETAVAIFRRAIPILSSEEPPPYVWISRAHREIGASLEARNDLVEARSEYEAGLALIEQYAPSEFDEWSEQSLGLARIDYRAGAFDAAQLRYEAVLSQQRRHRGNDHPKVANALSHLSDVDRARGDRDAARVKREEALRILESSVGPTHPWVASALGDLAAVMYRDEDLPAAERMLRRAADISDRSRGKGSSAGSVHRMLLGINLMRQKQYEAATEQLEPTLRLFESQMGASSTPSLRTRKLLINSWIQLGRSEDALPLASRHLEALENSQWADDSHERRQAYDLLQHAAALAGRFDEALDAADRKLELELADPKSSAEQKVAVVSDTLNLYREHGSEAEVRQWEARLAELIPIPPENSDENGVPPGG